MKRIETLVKQGKADLDAHTYRTFDRNGYGPMEIAKAIDKIRAAEKVLRRAYEGGA